MRRIALLVSIVLVCLCGATAQEIGNGIAWWQLMRLSPDSVYGAYDPRIAVQGDTVHITWMNSGLKFPYVRSIDGGRTFEPLRELSPGSTGFVGLCRILSGGGRLYAFFDELSDSNTYEIYSMHSDDHGDTWSSPHITIGGLNYQDNSASAFGDTVAFMASGPFTPPGYKIVLSVDGGDHWTMSSSWFQGNFPQVRVTPGALHYVEGWGYDSSGTFAEYVALYRRSTDLGQTWSDPIPMSTMDTRINALSVSVDPSGGEDSSKIMLLWNDEKYGCLSPTGCSLIGRISYDNGRTFEPERRYDKRAAAEEARGAMQGKFMAMNWGDSYPDWAAQVQVIASTDGGHNWTEPYGIIDTCYGMVAVSNNTIHVVVEKIVGDYNANPHWHTFYRRGVMLSSAVESTFVYDRGWNLLSLPVQVSDPRKSIVYPYSTAYGYDDGYSMVESLKTGEGYWIKLDEYHRQFNLSGEALTAETLIVRKGWNIIGAATGMSVPIGLLHPDPAEMQLSSFFGFNKGYAPADTLQTGRGYWVKADTDGMLIVNGSLNGAKSAGVESETPSGSVTIQDATGSKQTLFFGVTGKNHNWEMPPEPPEGLFDCRFASGNYAEFAENHPSGSVPITTNSAVAPLTISWDCRAGAPPANLLIGGYSIALNDRGSTRIADPLATLALKFTAVKTAVPTEFSLSQNYPNPFNPSTRIRFTLPAEGRVELKIYDLFGKEVETLVNERLEAGVHDAEWNATNVASGVYFYRVQWQSGSGEAKSSSNKMLVMR